MTTKKNNPKATKPQPKKKKKWPRGITVTKRKDRNKWQVNWAEFVEGKRVRHAKLYDTSELAEAFADELADTVKEHGTKILSFDPQRWEKFAQLEKALEGADLFDVLNVWREHLVKKRKANIQTGKAVAEWTDIVTAEGISVDHLAHVKKHIGRFVEFVGEDTPVGDLSSEDVREWLAALADDGDGDGEGFEAVTIIHHLKTVRAFFQRAMSEHWITENPADKSRVKGPRVIAKERLALSIREARALFAANRDFRVVGRLALETFAGLRYTGAVRLREQDVVWKDKAILLPEARHKTGRFVLDGLPENFWQWLRHAAKLPGFWDMTQRQYLEEKAAAFARAGVENPGNILRRSFCSWGIALHGDANKVATMMQHRGPDMLYKKYRTSVTRDGFVTKKEAGAWLKIVP